MRKYIAGMIAVTAMLSLTACGLLDWVGDTGVPNTPSYANKLPPRETTAPTEATEPTKESTPVSSADKNEIIGVVQSMYAAAVDSDASEMLRCMYPDELVDEIEVTDSVGTFANMVTNTGFKPMDLTGLAISSVEDADEEIVKAIRQYYNAMILSFRQLSAMGYNVGKLQSGGYTQDEVNQFNAITGEFFSITDFTELDVEQVVEISAVKCITFNNSELGTLYMYKINGEGWRSDSVVAPMVNFFKMTFGEVAIASAKGISDAANTAATRLEEEKTDLSGTCILSFDSSLERFAEDCKVPADEVKRLMDKYFERLDDEKYFLVFSNGACIYCVVKHNYALGTYPPDKRLVSLTDQRTDDADMSGYTFEELYAECEKLIAN